MQLEHFQCLLLATLLLVTVFSNKLYKITSSLLQFLLVNHFPFKKKYHLTFRWMVGNGKGLFNLYRFTASLGKIP